MPTTPGKTQPSGSPDPGYRGRSKGKIEALSRQHPWPPRFPIIGAVCVMSLPVMICPSEATILAETPMLWPCPCFRSLLRNRLVDVIVQLWEIMGLDPDLRRTADRGPLGI
jgi:hypothetical protein